MTGPRIQGWQDIEAEVLRRIHARDWPPGSAIPNEADLAREFGVARATVNRALQALADAGWLDRRRKAGTRVALHPVRRATLHIPILRTEIEASGQTYGYRLLTQDSDPAPNPMAFHTPATLSPLHLTALHLANDYPYAHEDRWINPAAVPDILNVDLARQSANEWLVANAPFTRGDYVIGACAADAAMAALLNTVPQKALVTVERQTWNGDTPITWVRLTFRPGHQIRTAF